MSVKIEVRDSDEIFRLIESDRAGLFELSGNALLQPLRSVHFRCYISSPLPVRGYMMIASIVIGPQESQENFERFRVKSLLPLPSSQFSGQLFSHRQDDEEISISPSGDNIERFRVTKLLRAIGITTNTLPVQDANTFYSTIIEFKELVELVIDSLYGQLKNGASIRYRCQSACIAIPKDNTVVSEAVVPSDVIPQKASGHETYKEFCQICDSRVALNLQFKYRRVNCDICSNPVEKILNLHHERFDAHICSFECEEIDYRQKLDRERLSQV